MELDNDGAFVVGVRWRSELFEWSDLYGRQLFRELVEGSGDWWQKQGVRSGRRDHELTYDHQAQRDDATGGLALGFPGS